MLTTVPSEPVGRIVTNLTIINRLDEADAARGRLAPGEVRSVTLDEVLVDTGATTLCLPADVIAALGLAPLREVDSATAGGLGRARLFQDAKIALLGRESTSECLELPVGATPLLGVIPLEALGIEIDLQRQQLRLLPDRSKDTYFTVM